MRKLFRLKEWLTLDEAARHLCLVLDEPVATADVLRLALDGHLTLSINLINHANADLGAVFPYRDVRKMELPSMGADGEPTGQTFTVPMGVPLDHSIVSLTEETPFVCFNDDDPTRVEGLWDLSMVGGERIDIEDRFQRLTGGPAVELIDLQGLLVSRPDGTWARLLSQREDTFVADEWGGKLKIKGDFYPASSLPTDAPLVVRAAALSKFESTLLSPDSSSTALDDTVYPDDLPVELDAALLAFQAIKKGAGDSASTPRNRIVAWLGEHYPDLGAEAVQRIATVANPDKSTGRKARAQS